MGPGPTRLSWIDGTSHARLLQVVTLRWWRWLEMPGELRLSRPGRFFGLVSGFTVTSVRGGRRGRNDRPVAVPQIRKCFLLALVALTMPFHNLSDHEPGEQFLGASRANAMSRVPPFFGFTSRRTGRSVVRTESRLRNRWKYALGTCLFARRSSYRPCWGGNSNPISVVRCGPRVTPAAGPLP